MRWGIIVLIAFDTANFLKAQKLYPGKVTMSINTYDIRTGDLILKECHEDIYDENKRKVLEIEYNNQREITKTVKYQYNAWGQLIWRKEELRNHSFFTETYFNYRNRVDSEAAEIKEINSKGELIFLIRNEFDDKGIVVKELWMDPEDTSRIQRYSTFTYNSRSLKIAECTFSGDEVTNQITFKYDADGRIIEISEEETGAFSRITLIDYTNDLEVRDLYYKVGGKASLFFKEFYDNKHNILKRIMYQSELPYRMFEFKYSYNEEGELIKREEYENEKLKKEFIYTFEHR